jgi:hypothetical protein
MLAPGDVGRPSGAFADFVLEGASGQAAIAAYRFASRISAARTAADASTFAMARRSGTISTSSDDVTYDMRTPLWTDLGSLIRARSDICCEPDNNSPPRFPPAAASGQTRRQFGRLPPALCVWVARPDFSTQGAERAVRLGGDPHLQVPDGVQEVRVGVNRFSQHLDLQVALQDFLP